MKPRSAKAKGRKLQQWTRDKLLEIFPQLQPDDVRSTTMGDGGEDVQLSPAARALVPYQIECKNKASIAVYSWLDQCAVHGKYEPILVIKQDYKEPLVVVDAVSFFKLLKENNNKNGNQRTGTA